MYISQIDEGNERKTLTEFVTDTIRYNILAGRIVSGEKIKESIISDELKVSRAVIREALIRLECEGLIEKQANRSANIISFDHKELRDLFELRRVLEVAAMESILDQGLDISGDLSALLRKLQVQTYQAEKYIDLIRIDIDFHRYMVNRCGNKHIIRSWETLSGQLLVVLYAIGRAKYKQSSELNADMQKTHMPLVAAFREKNREKLKEAIISHIGSGDEADDAVLTSVLDQGLEL